jgi:hypothetical protein
MRHGRCAKEAAEEEAGVLAVVEAAEGVAGLTVVVAEGVAEATAIKRKLRKLLFSILLR